MASGQLITSTVVGEQHIQHRWETDLSREFFVHMSNRFQSDSLDAYGTTPSPATGCPSMKRRGGAVLQHTAAALRVYSDWFGPYPYPDLRVASAPISFRGMEYPQVFLLGVQLYDRYRDQLEIRAVHEVAHQWWYQLVHNDRVNQPWVDEGLAEYSSRIYYEAVHGPDAADILEYRRWQAVVDGLISREQDAPLAQPVDRLCRTKDLRGAIVYGKGALLFLRDPTHAWRAGIQAILQNYLADYQYKIITPADMLTGVARGRPGGRRRAVQRMDRAAGEPAAAKCGAPDRVSTVRPRQSATSAQAKLSNGERLLDRPGRRAGRQRPLLRQPVAGSEAGAGLPLRNADRERRRQPAARLPRGGRLPTILPCHPSCGSFCSSASSLLHHLLHLRRREHRPLAERPRLGRPGQYPRQQRPQPPLRRRSASCWPVSSINCDPKQSKNSPGCIPNIGVNFPVPRAATELMSSPLSTLKEVKRLL